MNFTVYSNIQNTGENQNQKTVQSTVHQGIRQKHNPGKSG